MSNDDEKSAHGRDATPRAITRYALPRSYAAASAEAARAGKTYLRAVAADVLLIVVGAAFVSVSPDSQRARRVINLLGASCFAGGLVVSRITSAKERDREWLRARSRAEDIKSTAWRFMTAAQPYPLTVRNPDAVAAFQSAINRLNSTYGMHTSQTLDQEVTPAIAHREPSFGPE